MAARADVLVVGSGPAGAATAIALCGMGLQVLLVGDAIPADDAQRCAESMAPALAASMADARYGAFADDTTIASACAGIKSLWQSARPEFRDYFGEPAAQGLILDRKAFDAHLLEQARAAGAACELGIRITQAARHGHGVALSGMRDGGAWQCQARFVVDASGKACAIARKLGARRHRITRQRAVALQLGPAPRVIEHGAMLWIEADRGGWLSATVGPGGNRYLVRFCRAEGRARSGATNLAALLRSSRMVSDMVAPDEVAGLRPFVLDAGCSALNRAAGSCWMAVGDAAIAFDPVSSQGLAHAVGSAQAAAAVIGQLFTSRSADGLHDYVWRTELTLRHHLVHLRDHYLSQYPHEGMQP